MKTSMHVIFTNPELENEENESGKKSACVVECETAALALKLCNKLHDFNMKNISIFGIAEILQEYIDKNYDWVSLGNKMYASTDIFDAERHIQDLGKDETFFYRHKKYFREWLSNEKANKS